MQHEDGSASEERAGSSGLSRVEHDEMPKLTLALHKGDTRLDLGRWSVHPNYRIPGSTVVGRGAGVRLPGSRRPGRP